MKIFNSGQIKRWDEATISSQDIASIDLMERAARACYEWLQNRHISKQNIHVFCGKGNNGGDGLALARMLVQHGSDVYIHILEAGTMGTPDFQENLRRLHLLTTQIQFIQSEIFFPTLTTGDIIVDAIFGTGLNKPLENLALDLVKFVNASKLPVISIDIPSGVFCDISTKGYTAISATHTLSFQNLKPAFLFAENEQFIGQLHLLNIGLSKDYENAETAEYEMPSENIIRDIIKPRNKFGHKGTFGHASLLAGSFGMMGAAVLAARACLASGTGKLTCVVPSCGYEIIQACVPEAMCKVSGTKQIENIERPDQYSSVGIGPGIGWSKSSSDLLRAVFKQPPHRLLLDADALNCVSEDKKLLSMIPPGTLITPHPKEFDRIFGESSDDFARLDLAKEKAREFQIYIILKGHYTAVITPPGKVYFNSTGNAGMAKAGMGDVLTGLITGLMSQGYILPEAAILGVYIHGLAGDYASERYSQHAMQASNLIDCLPDAWRFLTS